MSILSKLFGNKGATEALKGEDYKGFVIFAEPIREGKTYRLAARIEQGEGDNLKSHQLIRADTFQNDDQAREASRLKAIQMIDEQGDRLFGSP